MSVDWLGDHAFIDASIADVVLEDVTLTRAHAAAFAGFGALGSLRIANVTLSHPLATGKPQLGPVPTKAGNLVEISDAHLPSLALAQFANVASIAVKRSQIGELLHGGGPPLGRVASLTFKRCRIGRLSENALGSLANVSLLSFSDSQLGGLFSGAFKGASVGSLLFTASDLGKVHEQAFAGLVATANITLHDVIAAHIHHNAFGRVRAAAFAIRNSKLPRLRPHTFAGLQAGSFVLEGNSIGNWSSKALRGLSVTGRATIASNRIEDWSAGALRGFYAGSVKLEGNIFACRCDGAFQQLFALLKDTKGALGQWEAGPAYCQATKTDPILPMWKFLGACSKASQATRKLNTPGLACEQKDVLVHCSCLEDELVLDKVPPPPCRRQPNKRWRKLFQSLTGAWDAGTGWAVVDGCGTLSLAADFLAPAGELMGFTLSASRLHIAAGAFVDLPNLRRQTSPH